MDFAVSSTNLGRIGTVTYREPGGTICLDLEFGGTCDVVAIIAGAGSAQDWDQKYPWARERKREILNRIANEVIRQTAPGCTFRINLPEPGIYIML